MTYNKTICIEIDRGIAQGAAPGIALCYGNERGRLDSYVAGHARLLPTPLPLCEEAFFDLASLTKVLATTLIIMRLHERGGFPLDVPLGTLWPQAYSEALALLTPRQLLAHCSGLPATHTFYPGKNPESDDPYQRRRRVLESTRQLSLAYEPGTEARYSDLGPIILGELLEQISGLRLDRLFVEEVSAPLSIDDVFFVHQTDPLPHAVHAQDAFVATEDCRWRQRIVQGQVHDENAYMLTGVAGHAGLFGALRGIERIAQELLRATTDTSSFLSQKTLELFTNRQTDLVDSSRALGWDTPSKNASCGVHFSPKSFGHTGFTGTSLWIDRTSNMYVILLANRIHPHRDNTNFLSFRSDLHNLIAVSAKQMASS